MYEVRYVAEHDLHSERGPTLLRYLLQQGADEFTIRVMALQETQAPFADAFEDELGPFERATAPRRIITGAAPDELNQPVRLWSLSGESLERLLSFFDDGLFHVPAGPDGWLEDLTIYRAGELVLGLVSHEREGVLRLTPEEHAAVARLGIASVRTGTAVAY